MAVANALLAPRLLRNQFDWQVNLYETLHFSILEADRDSHWLPPPPLRRSIASHPRMSSGNAMYEPLHYECVNILHNKIAGCCVIAGHHVQPTDFNAATRASPAPTKSLTIIVLRKLQNAFRVCQVVLDAHTRHPIQPGRVVDRMKFGRRSAIVHHIEPIVTFETVGSFIFVVGERHLAHAGPALDLDKTHLLAQGIG